jgi:hypothetical protein
MVLGIALLAAELPSGGGLFPRQSTVVLLAGLPGDVESENNYRDQLQSWLDLIAGGRNPAQLFVLCDNPDAVKLPPALTRTSAPTFPGTAPSTLAKVLKADRTNFLALAPALAGATNPLVLIAWGHGGRQGNTQVFHVRGPRITPSDFKGVASQAGALDSCWILMFPGSGSFASQLAGEHRQILSSECDTAFASDPVGMSLVLKLVADKPDLSFEDLANEFGRATANWYASRNLARTEEPTFWRATDKPRLLASGSETNAFASINPEESGSKPKKQVEPEPVKGDLPPAWREIQRVAPQTYPDADGVVLRRRSSFTLGSNPAVASEQDEYIQILTAEGKRFGDFDISYSPPFEDINFLDCEVLRADDKLVRLNPDAIRDNPEQSVGDYHQGQRKFFSLPGVAPGAILHVRYRTEWKSFPLPHVSLEVPVDQGLPTVSATVEVSVPKESPFHFALDDLPASDPVISQAEYGTTYRWRFENLPACPREMLIAPRLRSSGVLISTFADWAAFADWYGRISKLTDEVTPEIAARARELTREAKSDRDKVLALYNYVTSLRYVAVPLGVNSYRPHAAASVFQNQFGDCKDKANLFNALLHSLSIEANLVLVPRFSQADEAMPGLAFNHAISRVKLGSDTLWVDTTDDVCRFGMLPPGDPGRSVLVIDGQTTSLTKLPLPDPRDHQLAIRGQIDASVPPEAFPMKLATTAKGYPDYELRETARETREHGVSLPLLGAKLRPAAGSFALEKQVSSSVAALDENFTVRMEGAWVGGSSEAAGTRMLRQPFWVPKEFDLALNRRNAGLFLNQGYPLILDEEFEITLPHGAQPSPLPGVLENKAEPLHWEIEWTKVNDDKLAARLRVELPRGEFAPAETPALQNQLREFLSALAGGISISTPK